jgi:antitoxin (DNA-binding transcriptional repressor) of toxin-antitoxin stability system
MDTTFTELRNNAKAFFDAVEKGHTVRVYRSGKAIAQIVPIKDTAPAWKRDSVPLDIKGLALSREVLKDRARSA